MAELSCYSFPTNPTVDATGFNSADRFPIALCLGKVFVSPGQNGIAEDSLTDKK